MTSQVEMEADENMLVALGRSWGVLLLGGIISLAVGIMALVWPGKTIIVVAILFAIYLIGLRVDILLFELLSSPVTGWKIQQVPPWFLADLEGPRSRLA
jgi:uncharacterized membrane protein HdeD (DUF308 family)